MPSPIVCHTAVLTAHAHFAATIRFFSLCCNHSFFFSLCYSITFSFILSFKRLIYSTDGKLISAFRTGNNIHATRLTSIGSIKSRVLTVL
ncbi:uncharacterized protein ASPGLDRAFT_1051554 [Aspergillus glaucus CBS 516.65]|uniref:Uncharacterized protein n=1 Tax=Aspergillus glaucus CBS 516.65 TaxID=1160497 RepID=A0A1L9V679_ASPGL|nr:hypothetical protein ASPGLDRAFT_1051554 [Aspergillus glaucus CBS 516.65]OJJ79418.1 hypothetical protein ASPGLDRAFT_1051554 [Aspergillus glaucus CBS 516.65]